MTISFKPNLSPVHHLLSRMNVKEGCSVSELATAITKLPVHRPNQGSHPLHVLLASLAIREFRSGSMTKLTEADVVQLEKRLLRVLAGRPKSATECQNNALKHYQKLSGHDVLSRKHIESCIQNRLPRFLPNRTYCSELSAQALFQMIAPSSHPIETVTIHEWIDCSLLLYQKCSITS